MKSLEQYGHNHVTHTMLKIAPNIDPGEEIGSSQGLEQTPDNVRVGQCHYEDRDELYLGLKLLEALEVFHLSMFMV